MTEAAWLDSTASLPMLLQLGVGQMDRKVMWVVVACFRRQWSSLPRICCEWVLLQEAIAEGKADSNRFNEGWESVELELDSLDWNESSDHSPGTYYALLMLATGGWLLNPLPEQGNERWSIAEIAHASIIRDIFGNPFRPLSTNPVWHTPTVKALAHTFFDEHDFGILPVLADALEDAGCDNTDILEHCRQPGEHFRGCWVIDLFLAKE
jgi:hypothetical protein